MGAGPGMLLGCRPAKERPLRIQLRSGWLSVAAILIALLALSADTGPSKTPDQILLEDGFSSMKAGLLSPVVGAHTEYHYLPEAGPKGAWAISTFLSDVDSQRAWRIIEEGGRKLMWQSYTNKATHSHPMLVAGDPLWRDYTVEAEFMPETEGRSGLAIRYRNDRCYYFCGIEGTKAVIKLVNHERDFHEPLERLLAEAPFSLKKGERVNLRITTVGDRIKAIINGSLELEASDGTFPAGRLGLTSDVPTRFYRARVSASAAAAARLAAEKQARDSEEKRLQSSNPQPALWKRVATRDFGVGRNLRFGDLDGDGQIDVLVGQVVHHGPKDQYSEPSCLTAMTFDGKMLWQIGKPDPWKNQLTNDVAMQIHDLDGDGRNEVVYCMDQELIVADGATGRLKYKRATPASKPPATAFPHILGDCLFFCDLEGKGRLSDIVIKDRYWHFWILNERLEPLWDGECVTGHYPYAADIDNDGKQELAIGYSLYDHDGALLWTWQDTVKDHADGVAIVDLAQAREPMPRLVWAASDSGFLLVDPEGRILKRRLLGHVQNPAIANFRSDLPGLETVTIDFWGNQGIVHFFTSDGDPYYDFEPNQYGSMCLPVNWTGSGEEYFVHSANVEEGGMFDGHGRKAVVFPADGHPDMCNAVLDITGDCRDEVVVWDPYEIWVYTQSDNPKAGRLYKPRRNPLCNSSNYQATVSLPGWN